ncbi:hypothetical protein ACFE04_018371 [Oxalis oulophora]
MAEEAVAIFPCVLQVLPGSVLLSCNPIVLRVEVIEGKLRVGTPLCIPLIEFMDIGRVSSVEINHIPVDDLVEQGQRANIQVVASNPQEAQIAFGTHFGMQDKLVSRITKKSDRILINRHEADMNLGDIELLYKLDFLFKILDPKKVLDPKRVPQKYRSFIEEIMKKPINL